MADEKFFAWLDGELPADEAADIEARVAADPELQALADRHRAFGARLKAAFDPIAGQPVALEAYVSMPDGNVASLAQARATKSSRFAQRPWAQAASILVVFGLGMAAGTAMFGGSSAPIRSEAGQLVAAASLKDALSTQLASQPEAGQPRIGLTFRDTSGNFCRSFTDQASSGLACFQQGDWKVRGVFGAPEGQAADYRMASAADPRLAALIDSTIAGEPFDAAREREARNSGWK